MRHSTKTLPLAARAAFPLAALTLALALPVRPAAAEGEPAQFSFNPSVNVAAVVDDDLFLTDSNKKSSFGVWVQPRMELGYRTETLDLGADLGVDIRRYADYYSDLSDEFYRMSGHAQVGLLPGLTLRVANAFVPAPVELGLPPDQSINMVQTNLTDAELRYWRVLPGEREISFGARGARFYSDDYTEQRPGSGGSVILDDDFNADYWGGTGYLEYREPLGRRTAAYLRAETGYRTYDESSRSDNLDYTMLIGLHSLRFRNAEIDLAGGYGQIHFNSLGTEPRIIGRGSLRYRLPHDFIWRIGMNHLSSADLVGNQALETTSSIGLEKRFEDGRTSASVNLFMTRYECDTLGSGANWFGGAEVKLRRQLTRSTQIGIGYRYWDNQGDYKPDDMQQNRLLLDLSFRY
jgi:hypothetical protein